MIYYTLDTDTLIFLARAWEHEAATTGIYDYIGHCIVIKELNNRGVYEW